MFRFYHERVFPVVNDFLSSQLTRERAELLAEASGDVLEIGFGSGLSLPYYGQSVKHVVGLEPNAGMRERAEREMQNQQLSFAVQVVDGICESLPFADGSFDTVVSLLTLCSVNDVEKSLSEIRRILRNDGKFLFIEHTLSREKPIIRAMQKTTAPLWKKLACGCCVDRDTMGEIEKAGFAVKSKRNLMNYKIPNVLDPTFLGVAKLS